VVLAEVQPWGFRVEEITFEKLFVWHGEQDRIMPVAPVRLLVQNLPHCMATFYPDEGHFSTLANHAQEILSTLSVQHSTVEALAHDDTVEEE
jgi:poly(3-hydroxyalkanoate) synthetase